MGMTGSFDYGLVSWFVLQTYYLWQWFCKNIPAIPAEILPLVPNAEFCASLMDNGATFSNPQA